MEDTEIIDLYWQRDQRAIDEETYANVQEVIKDLQEDKPKGYTILIKGSNGIKLSSTVEFL